jgi:predicted PurR-regulated permease PerM
MPPMKGPRPDEPMIFDKTEQHPGARLLLVLACVVVVAAGLRAAKPIMVPFFLGLFLAVVSMPIMFGLRIRRVPAVLAIALTVLADVLVIGLILLLVVNSMGDLVERLPIYRAALVDLVNRWGAWLIERGLLDLEYVTANLFDPASVFDLLQNTLQAAASLSTLIFVVGIIMVFLLAEATVFPYKFQAILGHDRNSRIRITHTVQEVQAYLGIKTIISLATGLLAGLFCWVMSLDFPIVLGLIAYALNYIPTIGSVIAAVPALALALVLYDWPWMLLVGLGYLAINTAFGHIIEPQWMGRRMGLSTLVVVMSLLFWGWIWGPIGALLAVPLTMVLKIGLENTPDLKWIAILLDKSPPQALTAPAAAASPEVPLDARVGRVPDEGKPRAGPKAHEARG